MSSSNLKSQIKECIVCKRPFTNRKRWESRGQWDQIKYCSAGCKKHKDKIE